MTEVTCHDWDCIHCIRSVCRCRKIELSFSWILGSRKSCSKFRKKGSVGKEKETK